MAGRRILWEGERTVRARDVTEIALFVALAVACGFALVAVPNVELITLTVFSSGVFLGARRGALAGVLAMFLFTTFNVYGPAPFPIALAQVGTMGFVGAVGGWERAWLYSSIPSASRRRSMAGFVLLAGSGVFLTALYDLATTVSYAAFMVGADLGARSGSGEESNRGFWALVVAGSAFSLVHVVTNALIFCGVGGSVIRALAHWKRSNRVSD